MLDTLEGQEDCLPDNWIDVFETTEADYGRWKHESRRRVIDLEVRRRAEGFNVIGKGGTHETLQPPDLASEPGLHPDNNPVQSASAPRPAAVNARIDSVASANEASPEETASQNSHRVAPHDYFGNIPHREMFSGDYALDASNSSNPTSRHLLTKTRNLRKAIPWYNTTSTRVLKTSPRSQSLNHFHRPRLE